jgi:hypothetical protein
MSSRRILVALASLSFCIASVDAAAQPGKDGPVPLDAVPFDASSFAALSYGAGDNFFGVWISDLGRVTQITSPAGFGHIYAGWAGNYYLCDSRFGTYSADGSGGDFYTFSIDQPKGPNTLPLTIVTHTFDDLWEVTHKFAVNSKELELVVTQTLKNLGGPIGGNVAFARYADTAIDNGDNGDIGDRSLESVTMRDRPGDDTTTGHQLTLSAQTRATAHTTAVNDYWVVRGCNPASAPSPFGPSDLGFNLTYNLGGFNSNQKKTVAFKFERQ